MFDGLIPRVCEASQVGRLAFFVGAGISRPSQLPVSSQIIDACIAQLLQKTHYDLSCKSLFPDDFGRTLRLEYFCRCLSVVNEKTSLLPLRFLAGGEPSIFHYFLAACARSGVARFIVTTNFDVLIEKAFDELQVSHQVLWSEKHFSDFSTDTRQVTLLKVHGTLDRRSHQPLAGILADIRSVGKGFSESRSRALQAVAQKFNLLFLGYSGRDYFGAMPALVSCQPLPICWVNHSPTRSETNLVVRNWVVKSTGGIYLDADTSEVVDGLCSQLGIEIPRGTRRGGPPRVYFADGFSDLERPFALTYLFSRDKRNKAIIVNNSFRECEQIFLRSKEADRLLFARLYLEWVRTFERLGKTSNVYEEAIKTLAKAEPLAAGDPHTLTDIQVARCDIEYCLRYGLGASGIDYLPLIDMLIDQCRPFEDPMLLSRAYCAQARICANSVTPQEYGYSMALESYNRAVEVLEPLGAQDVLPIIYFDQFRLANTLGLLGEAARAIVACLRGALLLAESPYADWVLGILGYVSLVLSDRRYGNQRDWIAEQLTLLGLDPEEISHRRERP